MDGLECKEISFSSINNDFRMDSDYFLKAYLQLESILKSIKNTTIENVGKVTDGIHTSIDYDDNSDINLISATSPRFNTFDISRNAKISKQSHYNNPRTALHKDDIIISTVGTIGNCAVVDSSILPANSDRHVGIIRVNDNKYKPNFISTFLLSKYGRYQTKRETTGNVQPNLFLYKIRELIVPSCSEEFQSLIHNTVLVGKEMLTESNGIYKEAELVLTKSLGIEITEQIDSIESIKSIKDSFFKTGRLDAEYYQPKYDFIEKSINNLKHKKLYELCDIESGEFIPETNYGEGTISYIRGTDITSLVVDNKTAIKVLVDIDSYKTLDVNDLAFAMIGSVGNVSLNRFETGIASNNLGVIKPYDKDLSYYLLVYLVSDIGRSFFERYQTRTAQPKIRKEDVGSFLVPILDDSEIRYISEKAEESFKLKEQADFLLETAKQAVEMAIEQGEETAIAWLKDKVSLANENRKEV